MVLSDNQPLGGTDRLSCPLIFVFGKLHPGTGRGNRDRLPGGGGRKTGPSCSFSVQRARLREEILTFWASPHCPHKFRYISSTGLLYSKTPSGMSTRILLVGVVNSGRERWAKIAALEELAALCKTSGGTVVEKLIQVRAQPDPATLIGKGKALEINIICATYDIDLIVFDDELTPTQLRNLEDIIGVRVLDRPALILDIFAIHARTAEAKTQVELAQLEYLKTRLTGLGVEMSRLGGGIGTRGPGETQLEVDRRRIEQRIQTLRQKLIRIDRERQVQRKRRSNILRFALVGYTNAGKSTIFNRLTKARAKVSNELFATLDASTRVLELSRNLPVVLTDTVGFIRNLPAQLIASFRSTLGEIKDADLILLVADASTPQVEEQIATVQETLRAIGADEKPTLFLFNKIDRVFDETALLRLKEHHEGAVFISALTGCGIDKLLEKMRSLVNNHLATKTFIIPSNRWDLITKILNTGEVLIDEEINGKRRLKIRGFPIELARLHKHLTTIR